MDQNFALIWLQLKSSLVRKTGHSQKLCNYWKPTWTSNYSLKNIRKWPLQNHSLL